MLGSVLQATMQKFQTYDLRTSAQLRQEKPGGTKPCKAIDGLATYTGYCCTHDGCGYYSRRLDKIKYEHVALHGTKAGAHSTASPLWRECKLQTYFTAKGRIDYFVVVEAAAGTTEAAGQTVRPQKELLDKLKDSLCKAKDDLEVQAGTVQEPGSKSERVPWLGRMGFAAHLRGLRDSEIRASYVPTAKAGPR